MSCRRPTLRHAFAVFIATVLLNSAWAQNRVSTEVKGGNEDLRSNIVAHLGIDAACDISEPRLKRQLRSADQAINDALRALGYYHGQWQVSVSKQRQREQGLGKRLSNQWLDCWQVLVDLQAGPVTRLSAVDVTLLGEAGQDPAFRDFLASLPLKEGDRLHHGRYEEIKKGLNQRARNRGYFDAKLLSHRLEVDTDSNTARIELRFDSGPRYRFGPLQFSESPLSEGLLRRFMPFASGDYFDSEKLIEFQSKLISSAYFDSVSVDQQRPEAGHLAIPIDVNTSAKSRYETTAGIGASTDTGPRLSYGLRNRRVNAKGDTYQVSSQLSPVQSNLGFQYAQPRDQPLTEKVLWSTGVQREDTDTADSISYRAEVALIDELRWGWLQTSSLKFLREDYEIADQDESSVLIIPGIAWSQSRADNPRYPTKGWRLHTALRGASKNLASDVDMLQFEADGKIILPLLGGRVISRAGVGATALDDFDELPASLRFFAGGDNSVRGFGYKELGPENSDGEVVGGKHRLTASVEYDHKVWREFALATFYDVGNAFDRDDFTLYDSAGVGLRWFSPIGPIRIDLAFPLKDGGFRVHLSMGPDL